MNRTDLVEIKKGEFGTGLLIENDGYISMTESVNNKKIYESISDGEWNVPYPFIVDAVFQKFDIKNANGRVYPERVLKKQVEIYQQKINEHRAYGELNHPAESTIDLGRISHNIIELHWEGRTLVGVSSRGVGSVEQKLGQTIVGDDFELICWDIVSDPSTPGAYIGHKEELTQYVEEKSNEKKAVNEKLNKINKILLS